MKITAINPATGEKIKSYETISEACLAAQVEETHAAFSAWKKVSLSERSKLLRNAAKILKDNSKDYARLMASEMGKPVAQGIAESEKCALVCEYYAENAEKFLRPEPVKTDASKSYTAFEPLGILLAVMPWNFPFWQIFRVAAPNLMAGNAVILKHASNVPGCAAAIEQIFLKAGFPEGLFRNVFIETPQVASLIENPRIAAVTLTGSVKAGKAIAAKAGEMLKKTVLELGGSDPYVILEDADLEKAVESCVASRLINTGQSCVAAKRFIVVKSIRETFENLFVEKMKTHCLGDPLEEGVTVGPMAREDLRDELDKQVQKSVELGARVLLGGKIPDRKGAFYPPTVLTNVVKGMPAYDEELFGPVAAIIEALDERDAVVKANDSSFGLGAAVFTRDSRKGEEIARDELAAGCCFVNAFVKSDPRLAFGGIKESGYGRELGIFGMREFVNIKTVYVQ